MADSPRFALGQFVATPNALSQIPHEETLLALSRHVHGDWGELDPEDCKANDQTLQAGLRVLSAYHTTSLVNFWIMTE